VSVSEQSRRLEWVGSSAERRPTAEWKVRAEKPSAITILRKVDVAACGDAAEVSARFGARGR